MTEAAFEGWCILEPAIPARGRQGFWDWEGG